MLTFQMFAYPILVARLGAKGLQRWSLACTIPAYLAIPLLTRLHGTGLPLVAASLALTFVINTAGSMVRVFFWFCEACLRCRFLEAC